MKNISDNLIIKSIQKVVGKGSHQLHEPLFLGKEINQMIFSEVKSYIKLEKLYLKD